MKMFSPLKSKDSSIFHIKYFHNQVNTPREHRKAKYFIPQHNTFSLFKKPQTLYFCILPNLPVK